jgi:hypothetical protein
VAAASQTPSATATLPAVFEDFQSPTWFQNWYPSGWAWQPAPGRADSGLLADKLPGVLRSRSFILQHPNIHFHVQGSGRLRVTIDGYMMNEFSGLLFGGLIQKVEAHGKPRWITISGALKKYLGQRAHIELIDDGPGSLIVDRIVTSDQPAPANFDAGWAASAPRSPDSEKILAEMSRLNAALPDHLDQATALADGSGVDEHVFIRGSHKSPGDLVPRRFLEALASNKPGAATSVAGPGSGRLQLAQQIIDPANPLTARVIVNRLWHHLLGRGIAPTVDNLGVLGLRPTHPELLDHLATRFTSSGGSIKRMIRTIMLSRTYQMSSAPDASASGADPANDLFHHMNVKRLEGEIIRDELLALSGRLDPKPFGPSVPIYLTPFMDGRGRPKESGPMDGNGRRSIYIEVRRNFLSPMFLAFDTPQPVQTIGRRTVSNVPAQALILMNDPLIIQLADQWAQRELAFSPPPVAAKPGPATPVAGPGSVDHHLTHLYLTAFSRPPTADEITRAKNFLDATSQNWTDLCHVLINTKEFIFIY